MQLWLIVLTAEPHQAAFLLGIVGRSCIPPSSYSYSFLAASLSLVDGPCATKARRTHKLIPPFSCDEGRRIQLLPPCACHLTKGNKPMTRDELTAIVKQSNSDTLIAARMREVLGLPKLVVTRRHRSKHSGKRKRYAHMDECRKQKHGVRL